MSTSSKVALILIGAALLAAFGGSITPQIGGGLSNGFDGGISGNSAPAAAAPTGKILLVDGSSHLLQIDGTSKICLAGGC